MQVVRGGSGGCSHGTEEAQWGRTSSQPALHLGRGSQHPSRATCWHHGSPEHRQGPSTHCARAALCPLGRAGGTGSTAAALPGVGEGRLSPAETGAAGKGCSVGTAAARRIPLLIDLASCRSQMFAAAGTQSSGDGSATGSVGHSAWAGLTAHQGRVPQSSLLRAPPPSQLRSAAPTPALRPTALPPKPSSCPPPTAPAAPPTLLQLCL